MKRCKCCGDVLSMAKAIVANLAPEPDWDSFYTASQNDDVMVLH